jgi:hypothetical protein
VTPGGTSFSLLGQTQKAQSSDSYLSLALSVSQKTGISLDDSKGLTLLQAWQSLGADLYV